MVIKITFGNKSRNRIKEIKKLFTRLNEAAS
jgi:hypothetical protein